MIYVKNCITQGRPEIKGTHSAIPLLGNGKMLSLAQTYIYTQAISCCRIVSTRNR